MNCLHHLFDFYKLLDDCKPLLIVALRYLNAIHIDPKILSENHRYLHNVVVSSTVRSSDLGSGTSISHFVINNCKLVPETVLFILLEIAPENLA